MYFFPLIFVKPVTAVDKKLLENMMHSKIDFDPFKVKIGEIISLTSDLPTISCEIPKYAIAFTYGNHQVFPYVVLQHRSMEVHGKSVKDCIGKRFIHICFDEKCIELCSLHNIRNCVRLVLPELPLSDFAQGTYHYFTWIKHELIYEALKVATQVFYFDLDVILLRNPWPEIRYGRDRKGNTYAANYDAMWQKERGLKQKDCGGSVNSGQLYFKNTTAVRDYFHLLFMNKSDIVIGGNILDQDFVGMHITREELQISYCTLAIDKFLGHCQASHSRNALIKKVVSYHTTCLGSFNTKYSTLKRFLEYAEKNINTSTTVQAVV